MGFIVNINSEDQQAINLVNFLKTLDFVTITPTQKKEKNNVLTEKEKVFLEKLNRSAIQAKEIAEGKRKGKPITQLLDEI